VGHSFHDRAIRALTQEQGTIKFRFDIRLLNVSLSNSSTDPDEHTRLSQWFSRLGWRLLRGTSTSRLTTPDLPSWEAPDGLGQSLAVTDIRYDLVYGRDFAESVMRHVQKNAPSDVLALYKMALSNKGGCVLIRGSALVTAA